MTSPSTASTSTTITRVRRPARARFASASAGRSGLARRRSSARSARCSVDELSIVVVTNDIFTTEDADALRAAGVLPIDRIVAVETGCCPHTAIRDDIAANLDAVENARGPAPIPST